MCVVWYIRKIIIKPPSESRLWTYIAIMAKIFLCPLIASHPLQYPLFPCKLCSPSCHHRFLSRNHIACTFPPLAYVTQCSLLRVTCAAVCTDNNNSLLFILSGFALWVYIRFVYSFTLLMDIFSLGFDCYKISLHKHLWASLCMDICFGKIHRRVITLVIW